MRAGSELAFSAHRIAELLAASPREVRSPTPEQVRVIEHPLAGSTLIIAGAGSGKTETIANRVVWLLANNFVSPGQILGLTFTRKAAGELNERIGLRLQSFVEALDDRASRGLLSKNELRAQALLEHAYDGGIDLPSVSTYDSYAAQIVQEFGAFSGINPGTRLIDEAMAWRIARSVIVGSSDPGLNGLQDPLSTMVDRVLMLDRATADHQVGAGTIDRVLEEFSRVSALPYDAKSVARGGAMRLRAPVRDAVAVTQLTAVYARLARAYAAEKQRLGVAEFSDQLRSAIHTVESAPATVAELRSRHPVVLLDEVQDTSVSQTRLLARIFSGASVMAVGDPHQSIYGWRGASAEGLQSFHRSFRASGGVAQTPSSTLTLSVSWRNPSLVLRAANAVARPLRDESVIEVPSLQAKVGAPSGSVEWVFPETIADERQAVTAWMREARAEHLARVGKPATAAVLFRARKHMALFAEALREAGVPTRIVGVGGLLTTPEVTDVVAALKCVWYADAANELIRLLAGPRFRLGVADLKGLRQSAAWFSERGAAMQRLGDAEAATDQGITDPDQVIGLLDALDEIAGLRSLEHAALRGVSEVGRIRLREAGLMLRSLRASLGDGVIQLIRSIEQALRIDIELESARPQSAAAASLSRANLELFINLVQQFLMVDEDGSVAAVLAWLDRAGEDDRAAEHVPPPEPGTVQLITMHGAKGLEWDLVAIPRLVDDEFRENRRRALAGCGLGSSRTNCEAMLRHGPCSTGARP